LHIRTSYLKKEGTYYLKPVSFDSKGASRVY